MKKNIYEPTQKAYENDYKKKKKRTNQLAS